jgi:AhpD family alkylhydroperoxidase
MMHQTYQDFTEEREALNKLVLAKANLEIKRFFSLDSQTYRDGELPARTKEMLGLVASLVLRCDDCIAYHLGRCREQGVSDGEFQEVLAVGLVVGGSIVIPHLRHAFETIDLLRAEKEGK